MKAPHTRRRLTSRFYLSFLCSNTHRIVIFLVSIPCYLHFYMLFSFSFTSCILFFLLHCISSILLHRIVSAVLSISAFLLPSCTIFLCCSLAPYSSTRSLLWKATFLLLSSCFASCSTSTSFYDLPRVYNIPTRRCSIPLRTLCKHTASTHALRLSKVLWLRYLFPRLVGRS